MNEFLLYYFLFCIVEYKVFFYIQGVWFSFFIRFYVLAWGVVDSIIYYQSVKKSVRLSLLYRMQGEGLFVGRVGEGCLGLKWAWLVVG